MARKVMTASFLIRCRPEELARIRRAADALKEDNVSRYFVETALARAEKEGIE